MSHGMRKITLIFCLFGAIPVFGQVDEHFSDGDFTHNPAWEGTEECFVVNNAFQLQSAAEAASKSFLFTPSRAFDDAIWVCWVKIDYPTSAYNYAAFYVASDRNDDIDACRAYYVRIGGANDAVSLFLQQGEKKTEIIKGLSGRLDAETVEVTVKLTRDREGRFELFSRLPDEMEFVSEGMAVDTTIGQSEYVGLMYANSGTTGRRYFFDDIVVTGSPAVDRTAPQWLALEMGDAGVLRLVFSEPMDFSNAAFEVDNGVGAPYAQSVSADSRSVELSFSSAFEQGVIYAMKTDGLTDRAGNALLEAERVFGYAEAAEPGDVLLNEVMFNQPEGSCEYIEVINVSGKLLDAATLVFTTRKADGTLNAGHAPSASCLLPPGACVAVTEDAELVRRHHACPPGSRVVPMKWSVLNNEEATVVLTDAEKAVVYDELTYSESWHHPLIRNPKGVALERISPDFITQSEDSWHSASSETNYGTPGYRNSQYRETFEPAVDDSFVWLEPEAFSPDNDGWEDVCMIHYRTDEPGYAANVLVFDALGVEVCRLADNDLLSSEGTYVWDGTLANGTNANAGVYVLYFEMFHPQKGNRKAVKKPVVVSGR